MACGGASPNLTAASASSADVSACLTAAVDGDTITVPAGSATWTSTVSITKYVKLIASGTVTITDNTTGGDPDSGGGPSLITITESAAGSTRIEGCTFVQGTGVHTGGGGIIQISLAASGKPVLITGNTFTLGTSGNSIVANSNRGVIWSNAFTGTRGGGGCSSNASALRHKISSLTSSWTTASTFGTADTNGDQNLYFEHNTILNTAEAIDTDDNGRTVIRSNTITNGGITMHGVDTSGPYGARYVEMYSNTFVLDSTPIAACGGLQANVNSWLNIRGGTALIHDNVIPDPSNGTWGTKSAIIFSMENLRRSGGGFGCWDTVTAPGAGYPSPHQTGWGYVSGATTVTGTNCVNCPVHQDIEPVYLWNNTGTGNYNSPDIANFDCGDVTFACPSCSSCPLAATYVQSGRDYFTATAKPGYTAYVDPHPLTSGSSPVTTPSVVFTSSRPIMRIRRRRRGW